MDCPSSRKTAVVNVLKERLPNTAVISFDDYGDSVYLDRDINDWSADTADDNEWHVEPIAADIERLLREPLDYILLDYPFRYKNQLVGQYINLAVFVDVPLDVALARRIIRNYSRRSESKNVADVEEVSLAGLDKKLQFYLDRSRPTYMRMPEMQKYASDLVVDGTKEPGTIANEILAFLNVRTHSDYLVDGSHISIAAESNLHHILDIDPFRRTESIRHAIRRGECYIAVYDGLIKGFAIMNYNFFDNGFIELLDEEVIMSHKNKLCYMHMHDAKGKSNHLPLGTGELDLSKYFYIANKQNCRVVL